MKKVRSAVLQYLPMRSGLTGKYLEQLGSSVILRVISIGVTLLYVPLLLDFLSEEKYGIWITLITIINWIRLFDIGLGNGLRNKLAEAIALDKKDEAQMLVSTSYAILALIFVSILLIMLPLNATLDWNAILKAVNIPASELQRLTSITISFLLIGFIMQTVVVVYAADGNTVMGNFIQLFVNIICLVLLWLAKTYATKGSLVMLGTILTGIPLLVYLGFSIYIFSGKYSYMKPSWRHVDLKRSGDLFKLSWQFFVIQITATILFASLPFVITRFYSPKEVTQYNIASTIFNFPITVISMITAPLGPLVTQALAKNDKGWVKNMLKKSNKTALLISAGSLLLVLVSPWIYKLWLGNRVAIPFMLSLVVGLYSITNIVNTPYSVFINSTGQVRILVLLAPVTILIFWGGCYFYSWLLKDVISIPIALLTANLSGLVIMPRILNRIINKD